MREKGEKQARASERVQEEEKKKNECATTTTTTITKVKRREKEFSVVLKTVYSKLNATSAANGALLDFD